MTQPIVYLIYLDGAVIGTFSTIEKVAEFIKKQIDEDDYCLDDYLVYKPPLDVHYEIGVDGEYLVKDLPSLFPDLVKN